MERGGATGPSGYESLGERTLSLLPLEECRDDELVVMVDLDRNDGGLTTGFVSYKVTTVSTLKRCPSAAIDALSAGEQAIHAVLDDPTWPWQVQEASIFSS